MSERSTRDQGISELRHGDKSRARELLRRATEEKPDDADAWLWLAFAEPRREDQIAALRQLARIAPGHAALDKALNSLKLTRADVQPAQQAQQRPYDPPEQPMAAPPRAPAPPAAPPVEAAPAVAAERQQPAGGAPYACPRCATGYALGSTFCSRCGLNLQAPALPQQPQQPVPVVIVQPPTKQRMPLLLVVFLGSIGILAFCWGMTALNRWVDDLGPPDPTFSLSDSRLSGPTPTPTLQRTLYNRCQTAVKREFPAYQMDSFADSSILKSFIEDGVENHKVITRIRSDAGTIDIACWIDHHLERDTWSVDVKAGPLR